MLPLLRPLRCIVQRALRYSTAPLFEIKPERLEQITKSPSGWAPPADPAPELPFHVERTRTNTIPVFITAKNNGKDVITTVRKVRGDVRVLEKCVRERIGDDKEYSIIELHNLLEVKGNHRTEITRLLNELGF